MRISLVNEIKSAENCWFGHIYWTNPSWKTFFFIINLFITFNQLYKTNSKIKHKKHKIIYKLYTRLYLVIYFSLTYKFARYHRWNRQKQPSKKCSVRKTPPPKKNLAKSTGINAIKDAIPAGPKQDFKLHTTTTHPPTIK